MMAGKKAGQLFAKEEIRKYKNKQLQMQISDWFYDWLATLSLKGANENKNTNTNRSKHKCKYRSDSMIDGQSWDWKEQEKI